MGRLYQNNDRLGIAKVRQVGNQHITLSEAETETFRKVLEPVVERWIEEVSPSGIDGRALVARARELVAKYSR